MTPCPPSPSRPSPGRAHALLLLLGCAAGAALLLLTRARHRAGPALLASSPPAETPAETAGDEAAPPPARASRTVLPTEDGAAASAAIHPDAQAARELLFLVRWEDGPPLPGAFLELRGSDRTLWNWNTDARGEARCDAVPPGVDTVRVSSSGWLLAEVPLPRKSGSVPLEIPPGLRVGGRVLVSGHAPEEALDILLDTRKGRIGLGPAPEGQPGASSAGAMMRELARTRTDSDGRFELRGLSPDWKGELTLGDGYRFEDGKEVLWLDRPTEALTVYAIAPTWIRGRVLASDGSPVPRLSFSCVAASKVLSTYFQKQTDETGRFRIPIGNPQLTHCRLDFRAPGIGVARVESDLDPALGVDLGEIRLDPLRSCRFLVTDRAGKPVESAVARLGEDSSAPSGPDGLCALETLPLSPVTIEVAAAMYRTALVELGSDAATEEQAAPIPVVLEAATSLDLWITDQDDRPLPDTTVSLEGDPLFDEGPGGGCPTQPSIDGSYLSGWSSRGGSIHAATYDVGSEGHVVASALTPGIPIRITILDMGGSPFPWSETVVLQSGERRTLRARVNSGSSTLRGTVTSPTGEPVPGAQVSIPGGSVPLGRTDAEGAFRVGPLADAAPPVLIRARGYAPYYIGEASTAVPLEVRLAPGREHDVRVLDEDGHGVHAESVQAYLGETNIASGSLVQGDVYHFSNLPPEPVEFVASWRRHILRAPESPGPLTVLSVPKPGRLVVVWQPDIEADMRAGIAVEPQGIGFDWRAEEFGPGEVEAGQGIVEGLEPGLWQLHCYTWNADRTGGTEVASRGVEIRAGETTTVEIP